MGRRTTEAAARPLAMCKLYELRYGEQCVCVPEYYTGYGDAVTIAPWFGTVTG